MPPTITGHEIRLFCSGNPQKPRFRRERPHPHPAVPFINELRGQETRDSWVVKQDVQSSDAAYAPRA
jgi:hypothetical protein